MVFVSGINQLDSDRLCHGGLMGVLGPNWGDPVTGFSVGGTFG